MSYYSALLQNIDNPVQPVKKEAPVKASPPQKKQAETQSITQSVSEEPSKPAVVEKLEGNDGGELGKLIRAEKDHTFVPKGETHNGPYTRIFEKIRRHAGHASLASLGQTCQYFFSKILANRAQFSKGLKPTPEIKVSFFVDFANEGATASPVPLKHFEVNKRSLGKYWFRVVSEASQQKGKAANDSKDVVSDLLGEKKSVKVHLHGGFSFKISGERGAFYTQRDLTSTLPWLNACIRLIGDGKKQEVSGADNSKVILSRFGLGGNRVKVETVFPSAKKDETDPALTPSVHYFELSQFAIAIHSAAKEFLPLVGTCVQELPKGTSKEGVESNYVDREKILKDLLKHKELGTALHNFEAKLHEIPGPEVTNYMREQTVKKVRVLKQQAKENENIRNFFFENVAAELEAAKQQAESINLANEKAKRDRADAKKLAIQQAQLNKASANNNNEEKSSAAPAEEKEKKAKKIVKKVETADGFTQKKTFLKTGKDEVPVDTPTPAPQAKNTKQVVEKSVNALETNFFAATRFETAFQSVAEEQYQASIKKVNQREQANQKTSAQAKKVQAAAEAQAATAKKGQKGQQQPQKGQQQPQKGQQQPAQKGQQQPQKGQQQPAQKGQQQQPQKGQQTTAQKGGQQQPAQKGQQQPAQKGQQQQPAQKGQQQQPQKGQQQQVKAQTSAQPAATPKPKQQQQKGKQQQQKGKKQQKGQDQPQKEENPLLTPSTLAVALAGLVAICYYVF